MTRLHLNQRWPSSMTYIHVTQPRWVNNDRYCSKLSKGPPSIPEVAISSQDDDLYGSVSYLYNGCLFVTFFCYWISPTDMIKTSATICPLPLPKFICTCSFHVEKWEGRKQLRSRNKSFVWRQSDDECISQILSHPNERFMQKCPENKSVMHG